MKILPFANSDARDDESFPMLLREKEEDETPPPSSLGLLSRLSESSLSGHIYVFLSSFVQTVNATIVKGRQLLLVYWFGKRDLEISLLNIFCLLQVLIHVDPLLIMAWQSGISILFSTPLLVWKKKGTEKRNPDAEELTTRARTVLLLLLRGLVRSIYFCVIFYAIRNMPLGDLSQFIF